MLSTSALRSTVSVLALAALLLTACGGPGVYEKEMVVSGYDFREYTEQGFLITPEKYTGSYQSIGMLTVTVWPRIEVKEVREMLEDPGPNRGGEDWFVTDPVQPQEVVDSLHAKARSMGADAVMNFRAVEVEEDLDNGPTRSGVRARGFAIDRVEK